MNESMYFLFEHGDFPAIVMLVNSGGVPQFEGKSRFTGWLDCKGISQLCWDDFINLYKDPH